MRVAVVMALVVAVIAHSTRAQPASSTVQSFRDPAAFWTLAHAVLAGVHVDEFSPADLSECLAIWFAEVRSLLDQERFGGMTLSDFLPGGVRTGCVSPFVFVQSLLRVGANLDAGLLVVLLIRCEDLILSAIRLLPLLLLNSAQLPQMTSIQLFYDDIIRRAPTGVFMDESFLHWTLSITRDWQSPMVNLIGFWGELLQSLTQDELTVVTVRAALYLRPSTWAPICLHGIMRWLRIKAVSEASIITDLDLAAICNQVSTTHRVEFLAESMLALYGPGKLLQGLCQVQLQDSDLQFPWNACARVLLLLLRPIYLQYQPYEFFIDVIVARMSLPYAEETFNLLIQAIDQPFSIDNSMFESDVFIGRILYHMLLRRDLHPFFNSRDIALNQKIVVCLSKWKSPGSAPRDICSLINGERLLVPSSPAELARRWAIIKIAALSWVVLADCQAVTRALLHGHTPRDRLRIWALMISSLFACPEPYIPRVHYLLLLLDGDRVAGRLLDRQFDALRRMLWAMLFAEDQRELNLCFPSLCDGLVPRCFVNDEVRRKFEERLRDQCGVCLESLSPADGNAQRSDQQRTTVAMTDPMNELYKMPCEQHFVHRSCAESYLRHRGVWRCETCLLCRETIPLPKVVDLL